MKKEYKGYLELFKKRTLPLLSVNCSKRKSKSLPLKNTEPNTPK